MNISSAIVHVRSEALDCLRGRLAALDGVDVHAISGDGKMVVTLEAVSDEATTQLFERVRGLEGVLSAAMVYHRFESDPDEEL